MSRPTHPVAPPRFGSPWRPATLSLGIALAFVGSALAQRGVGESRSWTIRGETRTAILIVPAEAREKPAPLILAFHGHGGSGRGMVRAGFHRHWPEAIVVCPDGLPTKTVRDPQGLKPGWESTGDADPNRDLEFVREILKTLRAERKVDDRRIYATGHSNGAGFTYLLWARLGSELAAIAPSSAPGGAALKGAEKLTPIPILHLAGKSDPIVPLASQLRTIERIQREYKLDAEGKPWASSGPITGTIHRGEAGPPLVTLIHPGGHQLPSEFAELAVRFFKEHARPERVAGPIGDKPKLEAKPRPPAGSSRPASS